jgi:hypothetical protein
MLGILQDLPVMSNRDNEWIAAKSRYTGMAASIKHALPGFGAHGIKKHEST